MGKAAELSQGVVDGASQSQSRAIQLFVTEGFLEEREETSGTRHGKGHGTKLAEDLVPSLGGDVTGSAWDVKDSVETFNAMRRELDGTADSVDGPAQHDLPGGPGGITFEQLLDRCWLLAMGTIVWRERSEDPVN